MLINLANEIGLDPKRVAATKGGEFKCPCPACGGTDRFILWPKTDQYWCRQCNTGGNAITFCMKFMSLTYPQACERLGITRSIQKRPQKHVIHAYKPSETKLPNMIWKEKAKNFVVFCHNNLLNSPAMLQVAMTRGLTLDSIKQFLIGWHDTTRFRARCSWGYTIEQNTSDEQPKKLWLPKGLVIPTMHNNEVLKLKIRRDDWCDTDPLPKYVEVPGSANVFTFFDQTTSKPKVIVESELDAILVHQSANDIIAPFATGGASKKPDELTYALLQPSNTILFALDNDETGKKAFKFWSSLHLNIYPWPAPFAKSPGDAFKQGVDLRKWIKLGLTKYQRLQIPLPSPQ